MIFAFGKVVRCTVVHFGMVRNSHLKKTHQRQKYSETQLRAVLHEIETKQQSIRQAAHEAKIPRSTLQRYLKEQKTAASKYHVGTNFVTIGR